MDELLRLLDIVRRELGADDAHLEVGGRDPQSDHTVWVALATHWRVVATFGRRPSDPRGLQERLELLVEPFQETLRRVRVPIGAGLTAKQLELDEALDALAERAGARAALVFDERSPVLWGCSAPRASGWDLDAMERVRGLAADLQNAGLSPEDWLADGPPTATILREAGLDETVTQRWSHRIQRLAELAPDWERAEWREALQIATAVGAARAECRGGKAPERVAAHEDDWGVFAKGFAQIYLLALVYDGPYSELHAEGPLVRALPHIETLVLSLPPVEPPPRGAKVIALRRG